MSDPSHIHFSFPDDTKINTSDQGGGGGFRGNLPWFLAYFTTIAPNILTRVVTLWDTILLTHT